MADSDTGVSPQGLLRRGEAAGQEQQGHGAPPYVEHKLTADSEYCAGGILFKKATDGRAAKLSERPVE